MLCNLLAKRFLVFFFGAFFLRWFGEDGVQGGWWEKVKRGVVLRTSGHMQQ